MKEKSKIKARIFKALSDPVRLEILDFLKDGEKCVCEIAPYVGIAQPLVSRHLAILKRCGLVKCRKERNRRIYSVTNPEIFKLIDMINDDFMNAILRHIIEQIA